MSADLTAQEPSAKYLVNLQPPLVRHFDLIAQAPGGVARLRELILTLAVQGKLVPQDPSDEPASELLKKIRAEKDRLIAEGKIKQDKPLAEITDEEKPFELPAGWEWVRGADYFVELCTGPFGSVIHQEDYVTNGVPLINPSHMVNGRIVHDPKVTLRPLDADRLRAYALSAGDIVLARRGEVGRYALVTEAEHGWLCGTGSFFLKLVPECDRAYLALIFSDSRFRRHLQGESVGTTMTNLNQRILLDALIAVPPLAEQSRIVTRVEELMQLCDALEAQGQLEAEQHTRLVSTLFGSLLQSDTPEALADNWQRIATHFDLLLDRPEAVDALEQTILQLAVRGLLVPQDPTDEPASVLLQKIRTEKDHLIAQGKIKRDKPLPPISDEEKPFELPEGWEWIRLSNLLPEFQNGASSRGDKGGKPITVLRLADIKNRRISLEDTRQIPINERDIQKYQLESGDILITRVNGSADIVGQFNLCDRPVDAIYCDHFIRLRVNADWLDPWFATLLGESDLVRQKIKAMFITTAGQKTVNQGHIGSLPFPLPPLAEQSRIVTRVNELRALCAQLKQGLTSQQAVQTHLADALVSA